MVRVLLGHTWRLFREALAVALARESDLSVVAEAADSEEMLELARRARPDVAVMDAALSGPASVQTLCQDLVDALPGGGVLVVIDQRTNASTGLALAKLAPRVGVVGADSSPTDLAGAVRQLALGNIVLDSRLAIAALTADNNPLTEREREILQLAVAGVPTKEIGRTLHLSAGTVRNSLSRILTKTGARTRIEAMRLARESGWI